MVKSDRQDELGELAKSFNRMATQLSTSLVSCNRSTLSSPIGKPTSKYNQTLEQQVEERTRELTQAIAQLQTAKRLFNRKTSGAGSACGGNRPRNQHAVGKQFRLLLVTSWAR